jgi:hypothetical protein
VSSYRPLGESVRVLFGIAPFATIHNIPEPVGDWLVCLGVAILDSPQGGAVLRETLLLQSAFDNNTLRA